MHSNGHNLIDKPVKEIWLVESVQKCENELVSGDRAAAIVPLSESVKYRSFAVDADVLRAE